MRIAIIEDDKAVASQLVHSLSVEGDTCHLFNEAASFLAAPPPAGPRPRGGGDGFSLGG